MDSLTIFKTLSLVTLAILCLAMASEIPCDVVRVVDGDTIKVRLDGKVETVRIIGLDTPETKHPKKPVEYFGKEATAKAKELLSGKTVTLRMDQTNAAKKHRDRYGRLLAHVVLPDGRMFAEVMIREGYAHAYTKYPFDSELMERYRKAERKAREANRGLWKQKP